MVESITPNAELSNVHVKLGYQASVKNVREKLGGLQQHVSVSKLSSFVQDTELLRLEELKKKYGIIVPGEPTTAPAVPGRQKKETSPLQATTSPLQSALPRCPRVPGTFSSGQCWRL